MTQSRPTLFPTPIAGWREYVHLPDLGLGPIVAKLDTGARTAALHADDIVIRGKQVSFVFHDDARRITHRTKLVGTKRIKSSNGQTETRPMIVTTLILGAVRFEAEVTLTDRAEMGVPMLLGRAALKQRFLINPAKSFQLSRKAKRPK